MSKRNFSMIEYFKRQADLSKPKYHFDGSDKKDFLAWKKELLCQLKQLVEPMPKPVPFDAEIMWEIEEDGLIKRRIEFNTEENMSVAALLYIPKAENE